MPKRVNIRSIATILILLYSLSSGYSINHMHCNSSQKNVGMESIYDSSSCADCCDCHNNDSGESSSSSHENGECNVVINHIVASVENVPSDVAMNISINMKIESIFIRFFLFENERIVFLDDYPPDEYLAQSKTLRAPPCSFFV